MKVTIYAPDDKIAEGGIVVKEYLKSYKEKKIGRYYSSTYVDELANGKFVQRWEVWRTKGGITAMFCGPDN